jgi:ubiquinol-cytochrome c reductase cytochrome c subunit
VRRRRAAVAAPAVLCALLLGAPAAAAPPRSGIVRPAGEGSLPARELGRQLFAGNCSSCHGSLAQGIAQAPPGRGVGNLTGLGPRLVGVGARALDFYLRTGRMPLGDPSEQPQRHRPSFDRREIAAIIDYVTSLGPAGPPVPAPHPERGRINAGLHLFTEHCAGCHQIVGQGGVVTGASVPALQDASATDIAEAVRIGPYVMPSFSARDITPRELDSLVRYVLSTRHPPDRGGWGIGHLGPIPEGVVTWFVAMVLLISVCVLLGKRARS